MLQPMLYMSYIIPLKTTLTLGGKALACAVWLTCNQGRSCTIRQRTSYLTSVALWLSYLHRVCVYSTFVQRISQGHSMARPRGESSFRKVVVYRQSGRSQAEVTTTGPELAITSTEAVAILSMTRYSRSPLHNYHSCVPFGL